MKTFLIILIINIPILLFGQGTQFIVESFQLDLNDLEANRNPVLDVNDKKCALIKIRTDLGDITVSSNNGIVEQKKVLTEYWVYVSFDEKKVNFYKNGFLPLNYDLPLSLEESKVYTLYLTSNKRYSIIIQTEPRDAAVTFDNNKISEPGISNVSPGKHIVKIKSDGYLPVNDTIVVGEGNIFFSYTLQKMELTMVTITSDPSGSAIIVNNEFKGTTPRQLFLFPGSYDLQVNKEFYKGIKQNINVKLNADNTFNYILLSNTSQIGVFTFPNDAQAYLDGKLITEKLKIEGGEHLLETKKNLYLTDKRIIRIRAGVDTTITITLKPIMGNLQVSVNPLDATSKLFRNDVLINTWSGAKRIEDLQIGGYRLEVDAKKHRKVEKMVQIKENATEEIYIDLSAERMMSRKGKLAAVGLSALIPGLGQYYSGSNLRGTIYSVTGVGTGVLALYYHLEFNKALSSYSVAKTAYDNAVLINEVSNARTKMYSDYDNLVKYNKMRQLLLVSCASVYGLNLVDAILFGRKKDNSTASRNEKKNDLEINPITLGNGLGLHLSYTF